MLLVTHITVALLGLLQATAAAVSPSRRKLHLSYGLLVLTLSSGAYLVWQRHSPLVSSCVSGLTYLCFVAAATLVARHRLLRTTIVD